MNTPKAPSDRHTPGPWKWFGDTKHNSLYLATMHSGRRFVMTFQRWGMSGAQPCFQPTEGRMVPASELVTYEVGDRGVVGDKAAKDNPTVYRYDITGINCADARLIAAAPCLLDAAKFSLRCLVEAGYGDAEFSDKLRAAIAKAQPEQKEGM